MASKSIRILLAVASAMLAVALLLFYAFGYQYHFYWIEQNQLFLNTYTYVSQYFGKPGWVAALCGDWLTQLYYYKFAGPVILALCIAIASQLAYATAKTFAKAWIASVCALIVFAWLAFASFSMQFHLSAVISLMGWLGIYLAVRRLRFYALLFLPLAWWLWGFLFLVKPTTPSMSDERLFALDSEYYFGNYDKTAQLALDAAEPNQFTSFYYYLARAKQRRLPESLMEYPLKDLGTLTKIGEDTPLPVINMMNELYYELGDMTYAERAAMMRCVFSPQNRNSRMVKRLAEANLVSGDTLAAMKYLRMLSKTMAYKQWAADHTPGSMTPQAEQEIEAKRLLTNKKHGIRIGDNCYGILVELLESNPSNATALDYILCTSLILNDMDSFKYDFDRFFFASNPDKPIPSLYQQALMIYLAGTEADEEEWQKYRLSRQELDRFKKYSMQRGNPQFADTYWYYFDKVNRRQSHPQSPPAP